jgi:hypothetical protein
VRCCSTWRPGSGPGSPRTRWVAGWAGPRRPLRSLLAELGLLLGLAYLVGAGLGWLALRLVHGLLDVDPARPPTPLLVVPVPVLLGASR